MSEDLINAGAALSRAAPREWDLFVSKFREFADHKRDECVQAPAAMLPTAQGRAQAVAELHKIFRDVVSAANRIAAKR